MLAGVQRVGHSRVGSSVQEGQEGMLMLTEVRSVLDGRVGSMATLTGGGAKAVLADGVLRWSSGRLDCTGGFKVVLRNQGSGQRG